MIRPYGHQDVERILAIWLNASTLAHDFIDASFWESKLDDMRDVYLPVAETWVCERDGQLLGFISLVEDVLAAIFVSPERQGEGIGSSLLEQAKRLRQQLQLTVYSANHASVAFYRRHGFEATAHSIDEHTGHPELVMAWHGEKQVQAVSMGAGTSS